MHSVLKLERPEGTENLVLFAASSRAVTLLRNQPRASVISSGIKRSPLAQDCRDEGVWDARPGFDLFRCPHHHVFCRKHANQCPQVSRRPFVAGQVGLLDDQDVQITARTRLPPGSRSEQDNSEWGADRENPADHFLKDLICYRRIV